MTGSDRTFKSAIEITSPRFSMSGFAVCMRVDPSLGTYLSMQSQVEQQAEHEGFEGEGATGSEGNADYGGSAGKNSQEEVDEAG